MTEPAAENISDIVFRYAEERPDAPALVDGGTTLTYRALAALVAKATAFLAGLGVAPGDRVAIAMSNGADHFILMFALLRMGAVLVEVPSLSTPAYRAQLIRKFGVRLALVERGGEALPTEVRSVSIEYGWRRTLRTLEGDYRSDGGDAPALVWLSSGSTGIPKGQLLTHDRFRAYCRSFVLAVAGIVSPDRPCPLLIPVSISYGGFFIATIVGTFAGCSLVVLPKFANTVDGVRAIASWGEAVLPAAPDMCRAMLAAAPPEGLLLPELRALVSMGQPLFAGDKRALLHHVTHNLYDTYGAVGVGNIAYQGPDDMIAAGSSVGRVIDGIEVEIVNAEGRPLPTDSIGHVRARRPGQVPIFYGDEAADAATGVAAEWVYPGDIASFDGEGRLYVKGRTAELVTRRGVEIFPPELEEALMSHPSVREAAVVGLPVPGPNTELVAFVVKSGPVEHDELSRHCVASLAADKLPDRIFYTDALPRLGTGKVDRERLRSLAREKRQGNR